MSDAVARWYVVHTYSGYENKVKTDLEKTVENNGMMDLVQEARVPVEDVVEIKNGKRRVVPRKVFPGYVLVKMIMTDETWYVVRNTRGVTGFVGPGGSPVPLTEAEVHSLGVEKRSIEVNYAVGDNVRIVDGPLDGFIAVVDAMDPNKNSVNVTISMFGRETPVELELDQVELID